MAEQPQVTAQQQFTFEVGGQYRLKNAKLSPAETTARDINTSYLGVHARTGRIIHNFLEIEPARSEKYIYVISDGNIARVENRDVFAADGINYGYRSATPDYISTLEELQ